MQKYPEEHWFALEIRAPGLSGELLSSLLFEKGCHGVQVLENYPDWHAVAYFQEAEAAETLEEELERACSRFMAHTGVEGNLSFLRKPFELEDWEKAWRESLTPFKIGDRTVIRPSTCPYEPVEGEIVITVDPKMAFGSGHHETTQLAARALEDSVRPGSSVLDAGAGTGVLAMAAAMLEASPVLAVEIDPVAFRNLIENIQKNNLSGRIEAVCDPFENVSCGKFDIIIVNLDRSSLLATMGVISGHLEEGGQALLTGILLEEREEIEACMRGHGIIPVTHAVMGDWALVTGSLARKS